MFVYIVWWGCVNVPHLLFIATFFGQIIPYPSVANSCIQGLWQQQQGRPYIHHISDRRDHDVLTDFWTVFLNITIKSLTSFSSKIHLLILLTSLMPSWCPPTSFFLCAWFAAEGLCQAPPCFCELRLGVVPWTAANGVLVYARLFLQTLSRRSRAWLHPPPLLDTDRNVFW